MIGQNTEKSLGDLRRLAVSLQFYSLYCCLIGQTFTQNQRYEKSSVPRKTWKLTPYDLHVDHFLLLLQPQSLNGEKIKQQKVLKLKVKL